jgi:hypothetical protein
LEHSNPIDVSQGTLAEHDPPMLFCETFKVKLMKKRPSLGKNKIYHN